MNVVGLVTEHNPFHNGHLYHVEKARESCDAEYVVSVMSGHFLQRGEPALFNKWARAKMAVLGGVDIVVELPAAFSVRSAEAFARGAVSLLNSSGIVTHICFGSEAGNVGDLLPAAKLLTEEPGEFRDLLGRHLAEGVSFPSARAKAICSYFTGQREAPVSDIYARPNNILGIEYLKSLLLLKSEIKPVAIKRHTAGYHDRDIGLDMDIASATSIREELLAQGGLTGKVSSVVPSASLDVMREEISAGYGPVFLNNCLKILLYKIRTSSPGQLADLYDVTEGLENRISEIAQWAQSVTGLISEIKTKRYTWTRVQRILTYVLLDYTKERARFFDETGPAYIRILGLSKGGRNLLKKLKKKAEIPVIIRTTPFLRGKDEVSDMLWFDVRATDIYTLLSPGSRIPRQGLDHKIMPFFRF